MKDFEELKKSMLTNAEIRKEYEAQSAEFKVARELISARARAGLTQHEVAERMHTTQSFIARIESGRSIPSLNTLIRYGEATGSKPVIRME